MAEPGNVAWSKDHDDTFFQKMGQRDQGIYLDNLAEVLGGSGKQAEAVAKWIVRKRCTRIRRAFRKKHPKGPAVDAVKQAQVAAQKRRDERQSLKPEAEPDAKPKREPIRTMPPAGMEKEWRTFNSFLMTEAQLDPQDDMTLGTWDQLDFGTRLEFATVLNSLAVGRPAVAQKIGLTPQQCEALAVEFSKRYPAIQEADDLKSSEEDPSPRTVLERAAREDKASWRRGGREPQPDTSDQPLGKVKYKYKPGSKMKQPWNDFHTELNKTTGRLKAGARPITRAEWHGEKFGAANQRKVVKLIEAVCSSLGHKSLPEISQKQGKEIAKAMFVEIKELKPLCRIPK